MVVHFRLFETLAKIGTAASSAEILKANDSERTSEEKAASPLCESFRRRIAEGVTTDKCYRFEAGWYGYFTIWRILWLIC